MKSGLAARVPDALGRYNLVRLYPATLAVLALQTAFLALPEELRAVRITSDLTGAVVVALTFAAQVALFQLVNLALWGRRFLLVAANLALLALYTFLILFHFDTRASLDYALLHDNFREIFFRESLILIFTGFGKWAFLMLWVFVGVVLVLEYWVRIISRWGRPPNWKARLAVSGLVYAAVLAAPVNTLDDAIYFFQTAFRYYLPRSEQLDTAFLRQKGIDADAAFPLVKQAPRGAPERSLEELPNVFIIAVESFNANFVRASTPEGKEFTPFLNSLSRRGVLLDRFYGNSVQTARGHLALLCSILPSMKRKVFTSHRSLRLHCLPEILREKGYQTMFFTGGDDLGFDRTGEAMKRVGFEDVKAMDREFAQGIDKKYKWGWGVQDNILYRRVFEFLDEREERLAQDAREAPRRYFVFIAAISNHMKFDEMPPAQKHLYPEPNGPGYFQNYSNSIFLSDHYMREFFFKLQRREHLRNSIVVIVGDHGFPIEEHGNHHNEVAAFEENFRTPALLLWEGHVPPRVIRGRAFSQVDVAPTLLGLLGLNVENHFTGRSVFGSDTGAPRTAHLIQPYDGQHLAVVRWPWKYVKHVRTNREFLFDLAGDPTESADLAGSPERRGEIESLRKELSVIFFNQKLIEQNRVWPPPGPKPAAPDSR
ncbi:MAG: sulfatase-like hydrolase/transferase [Deltaproteobacteria bacterium]|nr:sulfatase-like hydrolase/transferase [Deltaproteobacteria bacterium]